MTRRVLRLRGKRARRRNVENFLDHVAQLNKAGYSPATIARQTQTTEQVVRYALQVKGRGTGGGGGK